MKSDFVGNEADLISSAKQISSVQYTDFITLCAISLKIDCVYGTIAAKR